MTTRTQPDAQRARISLNRALLPPFVRGNLSIVTRTFSALDEFNENPDAWVLGEEMGKLVGRTNFEYVGGAQEIFDATQIGMDMPISKGDLVGWRDDTPMGAPDLRVSSVEFKQVLDVTDAQAIANGLIFHGTNLWTHPYNAHGEPMAARYAYLQMIEYLFGEQLLENNGWVCLIGVERAR